MEVSYRLKHLAEELNITESAARKYYGLFEEHGHKFDRNKQQFIVFNPNDVELFRKMLELREEEGLKLQDAVQRSIIIMNGENYDNHRNELSINNPIHYMESLNTKMDEITNLVKSQNDLINEQRAFMAQQQETIQQLQNYLETKDEKEQLEENDTEEETEEVKQEEKQEEKKGFWSKLFGG